MKNKHILEIKYLGATVFRGFRMKITSKRFNESITINYLNKTTPINQVVGFLEGKGFIVEGKGEFGEDKDIIISSTFKSLKGDE